MEAHLNSFFDFLIMLSISPETRLYSSSAALEEGIQPIWACRRKDRATVVKVMTEADVKKGREVREFHSPPLLATRFCTFSTARIELLLSSDIAAISRYPIEHISRCFVFCEVLFIDSQARLPLYVLFT